MTARDLTKCVEPGHEREPEREWSHQQHRSSHPYDPDDRGRADENEDERAEQLGRIPLPLFHSGHLRSPYVVDRRVFASLRAESCYVVSMASSGGASAWQIATASASAAWLGVGTSSSARIAFTIFPTCSLSARP